VASEVVALAAVAAVAVEQEEDFKFQKEVLR